MPVLVCASCGVANKDDSKFCMSCGRSLASVATTPAAAARPFAQMPPPDLVGLVSFAVFLIVAAIVVLANPGVFSDLTTWFSSFFPGPVWVRPPQTLIGSAVVFFGLNGLGGFLSAFLRLTVNRRKAKALSDGLAALGTVVFAYLLVLYGDRVLTGPQVLTVLTAVVGVLIIVYIALVVTLNLVPGLRRPFEAQAPGQR